MVTPFAAPFLWLPVLGVALTAVVSAVVLPFQCWNTHRIRSLLPLVFLLGCFVITRFIDFTALWLAANFKFRKADRAQVVRQIASGELRPNVPHNSSLVALPGEFASASLGGGEIEVQRDGDKLMILFFTFRGVLDNFAGFVYTSDDSVPKNGDFAGEFIITKKIQDRWYYISAR